jgi:hypothetical protein
VPVQVKQGGVMNNPAPPKFYSHTIYENARLAIDNLSYDKIWRTPSKKPISQVENVRIDVQNPLSNQSQNLQAQINDIGSPSTIATILIDGNLSNAGQSIPKQTEVVRKVRNAFFQSLADYEKKDPHIWYVSGDFSNAKKSLK